MATPPHPDVAFWKKRVAEWYPQWREKPYFIPPVHLNRTCHTTQTVSGQVVDVCEPLPMGKQPAKAPPTLLKSDVRDDKTQQLILHYLHRLFDASNEALLVLSQLRYEHYLNEPSFYAAAQTLPRSADLKKEGKDRGDFDILVIHRLYGIVQCEIKAVGELFDGSLTEGQQDSMVSGRVQRAVSQLSKGRDVLQHLVSDLPRPRIQSALMLPHISRPQLQRVLEAKPELKQDLRDCLGVAAIDDLVDLCVTSDMLPPVCEAVGVGQGQVTDQEGDDVRGGHLAGWWQLLTTDRGQDPVMSEALYLQLLARFAGPATTVCIAQNSSPRLQATSDFRTKGQGVKEVGHRLSQVMLTPQQVGLLQEEESLVFLTGPPGTGKTVVLVLKALQWLTEGHQVHVCSTWYKSLAASLSIAQQLGRVAGEATAAQCVHLHKFMLSRGGAEKVEKAVNTLVTHTGVTSPPPSTTGVTSPPPTDPGVTSPPPTDPGVTSPPPSATGITSPPPSATGITSPPPTAPGVTSPPPSATGVSSDGPPSTLHVIVDEAYYDCNSTFSDLCVALHNRLGPGLKLWAASITHQARPELLTQVALTQPLRCPPAVTREVELCDRMTDGTVFPYMEPSSPLPSAGPLPIYLRHEGEGHEQDAKNGPLECPQCGREVARVLLEELGVGVAVPSAHKYDPPSQPPLRFRDVVILISRQPRGGALSEGVGVVRGLREKGLPVTVVGRRNARAVEGVATMTGPDCLVLAEQSDVHGLERKVVVWLQTSRAHEDGTPSRTERWGRLYAMSRCSSQLICVLWPPAPGASDGLTQEGLGEDGASSLEPAECDGVGGDGVSDGDDDREDS